MKVALGQFAVDKEWQNNAITTVSLMEQAEHAGAELLVLPEGILARDITNPKLVLTAAQPLDGPFMTQVLAASQGNGMTTMMSVHVPNGSDKVWNTLVVVCTGQVKQDTFSQPSARNAPETAPR